MKYNGYNIPDDVIDSYVDKLGCSIAEACDAWLCDNGKAENQEQKQLDRAGAGKVGQIVKADYRKGERKPREKKANADKQRIIRIISDALYEISDDITVTNNEKYIKLMYNNAEYVINLTKTRKKNE